MRRVVILEKTGEDDNTRVFKVVFWYPVPAGREAFYADAERESVLSAEDGLEPSAQELAALRAGTVIEEYDNIPLAKKQQVEVPGEGEGETTYEWVAYTYEEFLANAAATIEAIYLARLAEIDVFNPWVLYGTRYTDEDGGWVLATTP